MTYYSQSYYEEKQVISQAFPQNPKLCPVTALSQDLDKRLLLSSDAAAIFITTLKPYKGASTDIIDRWIKHTLKKQELTPVFLLVFFADSLPQ